MPGAFSQAQPYGMIPRVMRALGIANPPSRALSPMMGTIGPGKGTSTIAQPVSKGMGKVGQLDPASINRQKNLFGGVPPLNPKTRIPQEPKQPMSVRYASAFPSVEDAISALRGDDLVNPIRQFVSKQARAGRIVEAIDLLDVVRDDPDHAEKTAALVRLAEIKKDAEFSAFLRSQGI